MTKTKMTFSTIKISMKLFKENVAPHGFGYIIRYFSCVFHATYNMLITVSYTRRSVLIQADSGDLFGYAWWFRVWFQDQYLVIESSMIENHHKGSHILVIIFIFVLYDFLHIQVRLSRCSLMTEGQLRYEDFFECKHPLSLNEVDIAKNQSENSNKVQRTWF